MLIILNRIKLRVILILIIKQLQIYIILSLLLRSSLVHDNIKIRKPSILNLLYCYFIRKVLCYFFNIILNKCARLSFIFFELELFFLTRSLFIFIFFIYSIFNRMLFIFMFVILCFKVKLRILSYTKVLFHLTSIVYLNSLIKKLIIVFFIFFF